MLLAATVRQQDHCHNTNITCNSSLRCENSRLGFCCSIFVASVVDVVVVGVVVVGVVVVVVVVVVFIVVVVVVVVVVLLPMSCCKNFAPPDKRFCDEEGKKMKGLRDFS